MTLKTSTYEHSVYANVGKERILEQHGDRED